MALAILRMIKPPGRIEGGEVWLEDVPLSKLTGEAMRRLRLAGIAMVPQGSMNSLNPVVRIRDQIADALADHGVRLPRGELAERVALAARPGRAAAGGGARNIRTNCRGGMKQRACIAIAICLRPKVIIADEPTSALDVVVQRQVMETLGRVQAELGAAIILVGHDMGLMAQFVDRLGIMYAGRLVEVAPIGDIITAPRHPYTRALIDSLPSLEQKGGLRGIPGLAPLLRELRPAAPSIRAVRWRKHGAVRRSPRCARCGAGASVACHLA